MSVSAYSAFSPFGSMLTIDREKILGKGKYGIVYEGVWGATKVAIKRIPVEKAASRNEREVNALKKFDHENVIKLFHVEEDTDFKYYLVLEL
jgi:serine/threonine protein kinase